MQLTITTKNYYYHGLLSAILGKPNRYAPLEPKDAVTANDQFLAQWIDGWSEGLRVVTVHQMHVTLEAALANGSISVTSQGMFQD